MKECLAVVMVINFFVNLMLLFTTNRLGGFTRQIGRSVVAAAVGGIYSGACLLPGFHFLGNALWRIVFLMLMGITAFGWYIGGLHRCVLYVLLSMALGGVAHGVGDGSPMAMLLSTGLVCGMCVLGFWHQRPCQELVEVELTAQGRRETLLALKDTGNKLCDPITGQSVLVADAKTANKLLGLNKQQLVSPVETVASGIVPGLRLIPYHTVGQSAGMLLAIRMENVRIGKWQGSALVAFAPEGLGENQTYRALTGGMV